MPPPATSRPIRATRPAADAESLRKAYLELLKLSLADLANGWTMSAFPRTKGGVFSCEPQSAEEMRLRSVGLGWPLQGLTMAGLVRLDDLQECVETVVADGIVGDLIETGVWRGGSSLLMRATLDALGDTTRTVFLADSFQGLPAPDAEGFPEDEGLDLSRNDFLAAPLDEVRANFERLLGGTEGVEFVAGFFDETLPTLAGGRWSLLRLDGDTYESTWIALDSLYPGLADGGFVIVDDYAVPACRQAVTDYRERHGIAADIVPVDDVCSRWRRDRASEPGFGDEPAGERPVAAKGAARRVERPPTLRVPTVHELRVTRQRDELSERLAEAEATIAALKAAQGDGP